MMKNYLLRFIRILFLTILLFQFCFISHLYRENKTAESYIAHKIQPVKPAMNYEEFKEFALEKFKIPDEERLNIIHVYFPNMEKKPEFQMILKNPLPYIELVKTLLADSSVNDSTKYVVTAAMMDLDIPHLADLASYANQLLLQSEISEHLVWVLVYNGYIYPKERSEEDLSFLGHQQLNKHIRKEYVEQVFKNILNNPNYTQRELHKKKKKRNIWQIFKNNPNEMCHFQNCSRTTLEKKDNL